MVAEVLGGEPADGGRREEVALAVGHRRGPDRREVDGGVDEGLGPDGRAPAAPGPQGDGGGQVAAGAVTGHPQAAGVAPEIAAVGGHPGGGGVAVVDGGGEAVLGGEAVADAHHHGPRAAAQGPARPVVGVDVADHPPAPVEVGHEWGGAGPRRAVDADGDRAGRSGDRAVLDVFLGTGRAGRVECPQAGPEQAPEGGGGELREVDGAGRRHLVDDRPGGGFERHLVPSGPRWVEADPVLVVVERGVTHGPVDGFTHD